MIQPLPLESGMEPYPGFRLLKLRGRGGFGEVWKARAADGRPIALKFMPCINALTISKEIRSLRQVGQLRHPNLIQIDRIWNYKNFIVIAMELADASLLDVLEMCLSEFGAPLAAEHTCHLLIQAAHAIDFLNARRHTLDGRCVGIQHCDVKPSNMLLFGDTVKLCDFTLASPTTSPLLSHRRAGTPAYAAPEVFQELLSERSDQYALAVAYCHLRSGRLPFPDGPERFERSYRRPPPDLSPLGPKERPIVARALASSPQERWPSCRELIAELARVGT